MTIILSAWLSKSLEKKLGIGGFEKFWIQMNFLPVSLAKRTATIWELIVFLTKTKSGEFFIFLKIWPKDVLFPISRIFGRSLLMVARIFSSDTI